MTKKNYDWIIVGGGIAGISLAEILCRQGKTVLLLEKNEKIASETSKVFHEWLHSGALYSLVPDKLMTMRYLLGATDDLLEYYSGFKRMNLQPSEIGVNILGSDGWFSNNFVQYRYKIRKFNPFWMSLVSRSLNIVDMISKHDWLRRRAGSEYGASKVRFKHSFNYLHNQIICDEDFLKINSPDFTMHSRRLLNDLVSEAQKGGLEIITSEAVKKIEENIGNVVVSSTGGSYIGKNVVVCSPDAISKLFNVPIKVGFAPMAVVENVPKSESSFVELDLYTKRCINLLKKDNGIGQAGGITVNNENEIKPYLDYIKREHKKRNPEIKIVGDYVGFKKELVQKKEKRNYLYHINQHNDRVWSVMLGKFTLAFSMAPEFYRRVYNENPTKITKKNSRISSSNLIAKTAWQEIIDSKKDK